MDDDSIRVRQHGERIAARARSRRRVSYAETAIEQNEDVARRLIEGPDLLTPDELERADRQMEIARNHRAAEDKRKQDAKSTDSWTRVRLTRAWINTGVLLAVAIWGIVALATGSTEHLTPADLWHDLTAYRP